MRLNNKNLGLELKINNDLRLNNRGVMKKSGSLLHMQSKAKASPSSSSIHPVFAVAAVRLPYVRTLRLGRHSAVYVASLNFLKLPENLKILRGW